MAKKVVYKFSPTKTAKTLIVLGSLVYGLYSGLTGCATWRNSEIKPKEAVVQVQHRAEVNTPQKVQKLEEITEVTHLPKEIRDLGFNLEPTIVNNRLVLPFLESKYYNPDIENVNGFGVFTQINYDKNQKVLRYTTSEGETGLFTFDFETGKSRFDKTVNGKTETKEFSYAKDEFLRELCKKFSSVEQKYKNNWCSFLYQESSGELNVKYKKDITKKIKLNLPDKVKIEVMFDKFLRVYRTDDEPGKRSDIIFTAKYMTDSFTADYISDPKKHSRPTSIELEELPNVVKNLSSRKYSQNLYNTVNIPVGRTKRMTVKFNPENPDEVYLQNRDLTSFKGVLTYNLKTKTAKLNEDWVRQYKKIIFFIGNLENGFRIRAEMPNQELRNYKINLKYRNQNTTKNFDYDSLN